MEEEEGRRKMYDGRCMMEEGRGMYEGGGPLACFQAAITLLLGCLQAYSRLTQ